MSKPRVLLTRNAQKDIHKLDAQVAKRIHKKLNYFIDSGKPLDFAENLMKPADAQYRWRVGDYRVLFDCNEKNNSITILKIQHRREIYRK